MPDTTDLPTLHALLDDGRAFGPEYGAGLANHLPMLLHALQAIGAPPARLRAFARTYATRLAPAGAGQPPLPRWQAGLGRPQAHAAMQATFEALLQRDGLARTLAEALNVLMPGVAAAAFHGLLRTAHGVTAGHAGEVAAGLAYWASTYLPLPPPSRPADEPPALGSTDRRALPEWAAALLALPAPPEAGAPLIALRMAAWSRRPGFAAAAAALDIDECQPGATLDALARFAARLYATRRNFTLLHVVTSCQAMRVLAPWQPDPAGAVRCYATAVAAGLCAAGLAPGAAAAESTLAPRAWPALFDAAIASDDDHLPKIVHACHALEAALGGDDFRRAANRAVAMETDR